MKVLGIADSDSYVKWGASVLTRMPDSWERRLVVIRTDAMPSAAQLDSNLAGSGFGVSDALSLDLDELVAFVADERPDVVLLSLRGRVVRVVVRAIVAAVERRPFFVSGLPGISIPATMLALYYRAQVDLMILHSKREIDEFTEVAAAFGVEQDFALATLPFLAGLTRARGGSDIVFAAQAKVPKELGDRERLLGWLIDAARANPDRRVVLKLRAQSGEAQTHAERHPFDVLLSSVPDIPDNLVVATGPMSGYLQNASGLATVSSTAAIEAVAMGVPVLVLDDFGVDASLINLVFEGSGMIGSSRDLIAGEFRAPSADWLDANYFHQPADETWIASIERGVRQRDQGPVALRPQFRTNLGGELRLIWDRKIALGAYDRSPEGYLALAVGVPLRGMVRTLRRGRALLRQAAKP